MSDRTHIFLLLPAFHVHIYPYHLVFWYQYHFVAPLSVRRGYATDCLKRPPH